ncbi:MAG: hypothetical protein E7311_05530 [Clostridiales bacterium]|nr:hypothetical protein [Clostridiales bacterium]
MNYQKIITDYIAMQKRSLGFISQSTWQEEKDYINEHLNALCFCFQKKFSEEETEKFMNVLNKVNEFTPFTYKELIGPINKWTFKEAEDYLSFF